MYHRGLGLVGAIGIYFLSSLGGISIVKYLNYEYNVRAWLLFALLSRSTWIFSAPFHLFLQQKEAITWKTSWKQLAIYFAVAVVLSMIELLNSLSMSILPGSLYALLKGSDVGFSMLLSYAVLGKAYHIGQILGAFCVMGGVGLVWWLQPLKSVPVNDEAISAAGKGSSVEGSLLSAAVATSLCLAAAFLNASCSVWTEGTLKRLLRQEQHRALGVYRRRNSEGTADEQDAEPSKLLVSNCFSMWTSFFAWIILIVPSFVSGQTSKLFEHREVGGRTSCSRESPDCRDLSRTWTASEVQCIVAIMLALLTISRFAERLSKHWICVADSAVTFSFVQAARRLSAVFVLAALFHENFPYTMVWASCFCAVGFGFHFHYGRLSTLPDDGRQNQQYELVPTHHASSKEQALNA